MEGWDTSKGRKWVVVAFWGEVYARTIRMQRQVDR